MARRKTEVATTEVKDKVVEQPNNDMQAILEQMKVMQEQINQLKKEKDEAIESKSSADALIEALKKSLKNKETVDIDADVPVMSGCIGKLILSTDGKGMATKYKFHELGEIQNIPYSDLKEICKNMRTFAQNGLFYILDNEMVKKLRLTGHYNKMASADDILHLFEKTATEIIGIYTTASDEQKEIIISMILDRKDNGGSIDYNVLAEIGRQSGRNLLGTADED